MTAALSGTPSEQAHSLRKLADRIERGAHSVSPELSALLAEELADAEVEAAADEVMQTHASILAALAK